VLPGPVDNVGQLEQHTPQPRMGGEDRAQQTAFTAADVHDAVGCAEVVGGDDRGVLPSAARESGGTHPCRSRVRGIDGRELGAVQEVLPVGRPVYVIDLSGLSRVSWPGHEGGLR
jgi:hypothetical protein